MNNEPAICSVAVINSMLVTHVVLELGAVGREQLFVFSSNGKFGIGVILIIFISMWQFLWLTIHHIGEESRTLLGSWQSLTIEGVRVVSLTNQTIVGLCI